MFKMRQVLVTAVVLSFFAQGPSFVLAADKPASRVITLKSVELKDGQGHWQVAKESGRSVDLTQEQPSIPFFNDGRFEGKLTNFKIRFSEGVGDLLSETSVSGRKDFPLGPLMMKKESFVSVSFEPSLSSNQIKKLELILDGVVVTLTDEDVWVETKGKQKWH